MSHAQAELLPAPDLAGRLRSATAKAHLRLEQELDLLTPPLLKPRFAWLLRRFLGFHLAWEQAMAAAPGFSELIAQRSRLDHLRRDLAALGVSGAEIEATPRCAAAAGLARTPEAALGSLYVMEGSTLGGQVIGRALADTPWRPADGLTYFNPYGERTGAMWRAFKTAATQICRPGAEAAVEAGAVRTFELLTRWLMEPACA